MERVDVAVVGGGQAGLSASHELSGRGIEHAVLERARIGQAWRSRWDSFCLVTPNWSVQLPGAHYDGPDPDGYLPRDEIVAYLERYAAAMPIREQTDVTAIRSEGGAFQLDTSGGALEARHVIIATGAYQRPHRPEGGDTLPPDLPAIDVEGFTNERTLPGGRVLIVGSGQSGCQIAEELHEAGREVTLSCGRAPWGPRRFGDRDFFWWAVETGFIAQPVSALPDPLGVLIGNVLATGHDGGHDLHLRTLQAMGVRLVGRFLGAEDGSVRFAQDLGATIAWGDERYREFTGLIVRTAEARGLEVPEIGEPGPFDDHSPDRLDLRGFGAVIFAGGFRPDYRSWLPWPEAFDAMGFPLQVDGISTVVPGLSFLGVHFLRTRKSSILLGVGEDAEVVVAGVAGALGD